MLLWQSRKSLSVPPLQGIDGETRYGINNGAWSPRDWFWRRLRQGQTSMLQPRVVERPWDRATPDKEVRERRAKGWELRGDSKQCVCIYTMLILLTFHGKYCFAAATLAETRWHQCRTHVNKLVHSSMESESASGTWMEMVEEEEMILLLFSNSYPLIEHWHRLVLLSLRE